MPNQPKATALEKVWASFLGELDASLTQSVELHCLGGFVVKFQYGFPRPTSDIDYLRIIPPDQSRVVLQLAGYESILHKKYGLHFQQVSVATLPEDYETRLTELFSGRFKNLRLMGLDPYDLVLSKLERNTPVDRDDVRFLSKAVPLDPNILQARFEKELRPNLGNSDREDLTLKLWLELFFTDRV